MFAELNARSAFSFLRGASLPEDLIKRAAELGYPALAVTDHLGFQGSARAQSTARQCGIRALVGTTLELPDGTPSVICLAATRQGYAELCQHLTQELHHRPVAAHSPTFNFLLSTRHSGEAGLLALTGDRDSHLSRLLLQGKNDQAEHFAQSLIRTFGRENTHIQLTRHHLRDDRPLNRLLIDLARHLHLPLVASNSPLHATRADRLLCDAFTCLRHKTTLDHAGELLAPNGERHLKSPRQMRELFADLPEAIHNAHHLAERLEFTLADLGYRFPDAHDDQGSPLSQEQQNTRLRQLTEQGARTRYGKPSSKVRRQLDRELALIEKLGFPGYFLIVHEIVTFARSHGIFCQGRGSAANSAVCYALGITSVDPVGGGLLFERFLSENRRSWPDIDIDFPSGDRRELVIQHVFQKYGPRGAAMTANVITYRPRSAFREMSKVLGFPPQIADRFSDLCASPKVHDATRDSPIGAPASAGNSSPTSHFSLSNRHSREAGSAELSMANYYPRGKVQDLTPTIVAAGIPESHPRFGALLHLYHAALTMPRHLGQHSGGMIICDHGLDRIVPLQPATMPGRTIVQWDKDDCEELGIIKVDLLGLGMLAALQDGLELCEKRGHPVDPARIPKDDPAVFDLLCRADTIGTFQVESRAQMATLPIMKPRCFYDLAIEVAIIRPGPIVGDLIHPYLNRRTGREKVDYIHPSLEPVLARTLGVPLFQEQVLRMAMTLAGFNGAEADELRRAMAFKRSDEKMEAVTRKLRQRMTERQVPKDAQQKVIHSIGSFALYGFPESHAISFALIAYLSCWMKVHHPAEFYCGLINNQPMGFYSVNTLIQDAKRHGLRIRPISVIHSSYETTIEDQESIPSPEPTQETLRSLRLGGEKNPQLLSCLRLGLHRLKGLKESTAQRLIEERNQSPFKDLSDFRRRVRPNPRERRLLAASAALNDLPDITHRRDALWQTELPLHDDLFQTGERGRPARSSTSRGAAAQESPLPPMTDPERLATDFQLTGATTGAHPMRLWRASRSVGVPPTSSSPDAQRRKLPLPTPPLTAVHLRHLKHGTPVSVAGMVICRQRPGTAKGHCFISLEDETGIANLFVPRDTFHQYKLLITTEPFLLVEGRLQISEGNQPTVYTTHLAPLPGISSNHAASSHDFH